MLLCHTKGMKRTTIYLEHADAAAIAVIQHRYGLSTSSDAIRVAVRILAESPKLAVIVKGKKNVDISE